MISEKKFEEVLKETRTGLVFLGCESPFEEWIEEVNGRLIEDGVINSSCEEVFKLTSTGGRNDLVFILPKEINFISYVLWKNTFGLINVSDDSQVQIKKEIIVSLEDYKIKYADHFGIVIGNGGNA